ncbi:MAG: hypothetical protein EZS28_021246, partial [Streblomastix strix]
MLDIKKRAAERKKQQEEDERRQAELEAEEKKSGKKADAQVGLPAHHRALSNRSLMITKDLQMLMLPDIIKMRYPKVGDVRDIEFLVSPEDGY